MKEAGVVPRLLHVRVQLIYLALSEVVGDQHAEENGQHAEGLESQDGSPQGPIFLDQTRCAVDAGGTSFLTGAALQEVPRIYCSILRRAFPYV